MSPEGQPTSEKLLKTTAIIGGIFLLSQFAFTRKVRKQIWQRDGGKSVWSGKTEDLQASHIMHDRSRDDYDDPSNGRLLTVAEHMWDHINREGRNGLSKHHNDFAIISLWKRFWGID